jgi:hypothetical protein
MQVAGHVNRLSLVKLRWGLQSLQASRQPGLFMTAVMITSHSREDYNIMNAYSLLNSVWRLCWPHSREDCSNMKAAGRLRLPLVAILIAFEDFHVMWSAGLWNFLATISIMYHAAGCEDIQYRPYWSHSSKGRHVTQAANRPGSLTCGHAIHTPINRCLI